MDHDDISKNFMPSLLMLSDKRRERREGEKTGDSY